MTEEDDRPKAEAMAGRSKAPHESKYTAGETEPETASRSHLKNDPKKIKPDVGASEEPDVPVGRKEMQKRNAGMPQPLVFDLGSLSRKKVKLLKRGTGEQIERIMQATTESRAKYPDVPIVVVYKKKERRRSGSLPFPFPLPF